MNAKRTQDELRQALDVKAGIVKRAVQVLLTTAFQGAILFLSAGRLDWAWGWVYIGVYLVGIVINLIVLLRTSPETIAIRAESREMKDWDKLVGGLWAVLYFIVVLAVAGLDERFGWTGQMALALQLAGTVAFVLGGALFSWAMITNAHFSTVVRIDEDRGHTVCTTGPYRFVRHPGYVGAVVQSLAAPLLLGSLWALIPGGLAALLIIVRTGLEDRMLLEELDGYVAYSQQVRYRLLPGVW
jgi:protein-S-isoprenylcysteine O-methyltransferase Ste14